MDSGFNDWFDSLSKEKQDKMMYSALVATISAGLFIITALATLVYMLMTYAN